ncbi:hypothetical protein K504DRAFT_491825 [Pleomassaria siparia CBS 279.74]|uniref:Uncharacterized protein n=1 Tax=Pleomassaria siparia CBS 279.74 TaxID=1314801 RepID=A0A6G1K648_9PLEO|nr:hypothetical protein K504DRAFT_491825 [Pleomassaria siparia CBS 279.74]
MTRYQQIRSCTRPYEQEPGQDIKSPAGYLDSFQEDYYIGEAVRAEKAYLRRGSISESVQALGSGFQDVGKTGTEWVFRAMKGIPFHIALGILVIVLKLIPHVKEGDFLKIALLVLPLFFLLNLAQVLARTAGYRRQKHAALERDEIYIPALIGAWFVVLGLVRLVTGEAPTAQIAFVDFLYLAITLNPNLQPSLIPFLTPGSLFSKMATPVLCFGLRQAFSKRPGNSAYHSFFLVCCAVVILFTLLSHSTEQLKKPPTKRKSVSFEDRSGLQSPLLHRYSEYGEDSEFLDEMESNSLGYLRAPSALYRPREGDDTDDGFLDDRSSILKGSMAASGAGPSRSSARPPRSGAGSDRAPRPGNAQGPGYQPRGPGYRPPRPGYPPPAPDYQSPGPAYQPSNHYQPRTSLAPEARLAPKAGLEVIDPWEPPPPPNGDMHRTLQESIMDTILYSINNTRQFFASLIQDIIWLYIRLIFVNTTWRAFQIWRGHLPVPETGFLEWFTATAEDTWPFGKEVVAASAAVLWRARWWLGGEGVRKIARLSLGLLVLGWRGARRGMLWVGQLWGGRGEVVYRQD